MPPGRPYPRSRGRPRAGRWPPPRAGARPPQSNTPSNRSSPGAARAGASAQLPSTVRDRAAVDSSCGSSGRKIAAEVFLPHSRWTAFPKLAAMGSYSRQPFPQLFPQPAHNVTGVSAHLVHTVLHRTAGARRAGSEKCQSHRLERTQAKAAVRSFHVHLRGGGGLGERHRDRSEERRLRADAAARRGGGAVCPRRDAALEGCHLRRDRGDPPGRPLPAGPPADPRGDPRPVQPGRAGRRHHGGQRAHPAYRDRPGRRCPVPAHPHLLGADRRQRRLLRAHRPGARDPAPPGRGRHQDRPVRLRGRRRRRRARGPGPGRGLRRHRAPDERGLPLAVGDHARGPGRDRGDRQPQRNAHRRPHRLCRPGRPHQRPAPQPDDRHSRPPRHGQGAGPGHPAAHPGRLDDDGRGPGLATT